MNHPLYDLCYSAHRNTSHVPDRRAEQELAAYAEDIETVEKHGGDLQKLESLFRAWMAAKGRCASTMITGPANFPVARMQKANRSEEKHGRAYHEYLERLERKHNEKAYYAANPHARPIRSDDPDALERLKAKLETAQQMHAHLKANPAARRHSFDLQYTLRDVRDLERRIAYQQKLKAMLQPVTASDSEALPYVVDGPGARVYFEFDGKPAENVRDLLKRNGFKWTPSKGHWGRLITPNALAAAQRVAVALAANDNAPCGDDQSAGSGEALAHG